MILVFLQNTYEYLTDTPEWEEALWNSHTGKRLKRMLPDTEFLITNVTEEIGDGPDSVCAPDDEHIMTMIKVARPDRTLACGKVAQAALKKLGIEFLSAPHPAWRQLTNQQCDEIREKLG